MIGKNVLSLWPTICSLCLSLNQLNLYNFNSFILLNQITNLNLVFESQPQVLWSPTQVLKDQKGNSFDYSNLLVSLLIGAGYDAYVVAGYATREICNMDQSRSVCPFLIKNEEKVEEQAKKVAGKYTVKAPRNMNSKYLLAMEGREHKRLFEESEKLRLEELRRIAELERPPVDPLYGMRVHSWVLILSGKREVPETFFIESLTGCAISTRDESYLGIESVWNNKNYWVNMQSCIDGTAVFNYLFCCTCIIQHNISCNFLFLGFTI